MATADKTSITVETTVNAPLKKVWRYWNKPKHITQWVFASDDWHAPRAENDLQVNGKFVTRMEAKDGSVGFDFGGVYTNVQKRELIEYTMGDGRKVRIMFSEKDGKTTVTETFEPESVNSPEMQRSGWQAILNNFKKYAESKIAKAK